MSDSELIQLYFERSNALQSLWTLYVVILGGLLAFSSLRKLPDRITTTLVSVLFAFFAFQNLGGLRDANTQRLAVLEAIKRTPSPGAQNAQDIITPTLMPVSNTNIRNVHFASDILALMALWAMELRRRRHYATRVEAVE